MWRAEEEHAVLVIHQRGAAELDDEGRYSWPLHWTLFERLNVSLGQENVEVVEGFTPEEYDEVAEYLDAALDQDSFRQDEGDAVSDRIDQYRKALFNGLKLELHVKRHALKLHGRCLDIHIWPSPDQLQHERSIHSIEWEQLEDLDLWKGAGPKYVTVCRHVEVRKDNHEEARMVGGQDRQQNAILDVLLVVARPNVHTSLEDTIDVLNPGTVRSILLDLQAELSSTNSVMAIRLEIVRPGRLEELEDHLKQHDKQFKSKRPYDVVHFDMHGGIDTKDSVPRAFLQFNDYHPNSNKLKTKPVYAKDLGPLLYKYQVGCVILNACKTAIAHQGQAANFSSGFLKHHIPAVLAMSHNMHDSISHTFYSRFYRELLVNRAPISLAASKARRELFENRLRYSYARLRNYKIQDWFVPVVYTSAETPYRIRFPYKRHTDIRFSFLSALDLGYSLMFSVVIHCLITIIYPCRTHYGTRVPPSPFHQLATLPAHPLIFAPLLWAPAKAVNRLRHYWMIRQQLRVLAEDRKNGLRLESDLKCRRRVFVYSEATEDMEQAAGPFIGCIVSIWERTHFVVFGGAINAEWFVQPADLSGEYTWRAWFKSWTNLICLAVFEERHRYVRSIRKENTVVIIEKLDLLYLEQEELRGKEYYVLGQKRLEDWLEKNFPRDAKREDTPYLLLTALRGRVPRKAPAAWFDAGPGRCGVLRTIAMTSFVKLSRAYVDPREKTLDRKKWYDSCVRLLCTDASRHQEQGLFSALCCVPEILISRSRYPAGS